MYCSDDERVDEADDDHHEVLEDSEYVEEEEGDEVVVQNNQRPEEDNVDEWAKMNFSWAPEGTLNKYERNESIIAKEIQKTSCS